MLGSGLIRFEDLIQEIQAGSLRDFHAFIACVESNRSRLPSAGLKAIHQEVRQNVQAGDPTPFKAFRYNEYLSTAACFGGSPDEPIANLLNERTTITQEVRQTAALLPSQGVLIFGLSDKPDEASLPNSEQSALGMQPLHRLETVCVAEV